MWRSAGCRDTSRPSRSASATGAHGADPESILMAGHGCAFTSAARGARRLSPAARMRDLLQGFLGIWRMPPKKKRLPIWRWSRTASHLGESLRPPPTSLQQGHGLGRPFDRGARIAGEFCGLKGPVGAGSAGARENPRRRLHQQRLRRGSWAASWAVPTVDMARRQACCSSPRTASAADDRASSATVPAKRGSPASGGFVRDAPRSGETETGLGPPGEWPHRLLLLAGPGRPDHEGARPTKPDPVRVALLELRNDVRLLSEEYDVPPGAWSQLLTAGLLPQWRSSRFRYNLGSHLGSAATSLPARPSVEDFRHLIPNRVGFGIGVPAFIECLIPAPTSTLRRRRSVSSVDNLFVAVWPVQRTLYEALPRPTHKGLDGCQLRLAASMHDV